MSSTLHSWLSATLASFVLITSPACTTFRPHTGAFTPVARAADAPTTWDAVLAHPVAIRHEALVTGEVQVDSSLLLDLHDEKASGVKDDKRFVPVLAHLVRHPIRGDFLIDTGFDHSFATSSSGNISGIAVPACWFMTLFHQKKGQDIASQLKARDVSLRGVFFTHLHVDHTAGVPDLSKDIPYVAGAGTLDDSYVDDSGWIVHLSHLDQIRQIDEIDFSRVAPMPPLGPSLDLFGDGSLWAIATPGHSRGHVSFVVNTTAGPILLTGDASHTRWGWEHGVAPGKVVDHIRAQQSLDELRAFAARYPQTKVLFGHELPQ